METLCGDLAPKLSDTLEELDKWQAFSGGVVERLQENCKIGVVKRRRFILFGKRVLRCGSGLEAEMHTSSMAMD